MTLSQSGKVVAGACLALIGWFGVAPVRAYTPTQTVQASAEIPPADASKQQATLKSEPQTQKATAASEPEPGLAPEVYEESFKAIFLLFVLAVVLESALALLFNWRPFVETFNARAVRPLVSLLFAYVFVQSFDLDIVTTLVNVATKAKHDPGVPGLVLTALVLAGGSAGVNNLLIALGYRQRKTPETVVPKPQPTEAWVSVRLDRQESDGPVLVFIGVPSGAANLPPLVGVIKGSSKPGIRYFLSDPGRYPGYGGHRVPANSEISVKLTGSDKAGRLIDEPWGPYTVGGGAIIDLALKL